RVILVTLIGVLVGLKLMTVALLATAFGWVLIDHLERQHVAQIVVQGIAKEQFARATEAYRQALTRAGCEVLGETKNVVKGSLNLVFKPPSNGDLEAIERALDAHVALELKGTIDWVAR
ncbi:MAG TPA: hypothetical protein VFV33_11630, partial [Gemmatimonadaceae bacterium]|nr:hypothetical protein [Gemmatimonadaceae bacterium]